MHNQKPHHSLKLDAARRIYGEWLKPTTCQDFQYTHHPSFPPKSANQHDHRETAIFATRLQDELGVTKERRVYKRKPPSKWKEPHRKRRKSEWNTNDRWGSKSSQAFGTSDKNEIDSCLPAPTFGAPKNDRVPALSQYYDAVEETHEVDDLEHINDSQKKDIENSNSSFSPSSSWENEPFYPLRGYFEIHECVRIPRWSKSFTTNAFSIMRYLMMLLLCCGVISSTGGSNVMSPEEAIYSPHYCSYENQDTGIPDEGFRCDSFDPVRKQYDCIPRTQVCDGNVQCKDGKDENFGCDMYKKAGITNCDAKNGLVYEQCPQSEQCFLRDSFNEAIDCVPDVTSISNGDIAGIGIGIFALCCVLGIGALVKKKYCQADQRNARRTSRTSRILRYCRSFFSNGSIRINVTKALSLKKGVSGLLIGIVLTASVGCFTSADATIGQNEINMDQRQACRNGYIFKWSLMKNEGTTNDNSLSGRFNGIVNQTLHTVTVTDQKGKRGVSEWQIPDLEAGSYQYHLTVSCNNCMHNTFLGESKGSFDIPDEVQLPDGDPQPLKNDETLEQTPLLMEHGEAWTGVTQDYGDGASERDENFVVIEIGDGTKDEKIDATEDDCNIVEETEKRTVKQCNMQTIFHDDVHHAA